MYVSWQCRSQIWVVFMCVVLSEILKFLAAKGQRVHESGLKSEGRRSLDINMYGLQLDLIGLLACP